MRTLFFSILGAVSVSGPQSGANDLTRFTYTRVYCTADQESHFENVTVELAKMNLAPPAPPAYAGGNHQASSILFAAVDAHWGANDLKERLNHPAPAAQFVVVLGGIFSITTSDGEQRTFSPGDVVRVEDTAPCKGHITVAGDKPGHFMFAR